MMNNGKMKRIMGILPVFLVAIVATAVPVKATTLPEMNVVYDADSNAIIVEGIPQFVDGCPCQINGNISYNGERLGSFCYGAEKISYVNVEKQAWLYDLSHMAPAMREPGTLVFSATVSVIQENQPVDTRQLSLSVNMEGSTEAVHYAINTNQIAMEDYEKRDDLIAEGVSALTEKLWDASAREEISGVENAFSDSCGVDFVFDLTDLTELIPSESLKVVGACLNAMPNRSSMENETICLKFSKGSDSDAPMAEGLELFCPLNVSILEDDEELTEWECPLYITIGFGADTDPGLLYLTDAEGNAMPCMVNDDLLSFVVEQPGTIYLSMPTTLENEEIMLLAEDLDDTVSDEDIGPILDDEMSVDESTSSKLPMILGLLVLVAAAVVVAIVVKKRSH